MLAVFNIYFLLAIFLDIFMIAYFIQNSRAKHIKMFTALFVLFFIYIFGYMMIINAKDINHVLFWNHVQYFAIPFTSFCWLLIGIAYTGKMNECKNIIVLLSVIPILTFLIRFTNIFHSWYYISFDIYEKFGMNFLDIGKSFWYYVFQVYHILIGIAIICVFASIYFKSDGSERSKYRVFFTASVLPMTAICMNIFMPYNLGIDYAATVLPLVIIIFSYGVLRYDFLEVKNMARNEIFASSDFCIVILNQFMEIMDYNKQADKLFDIWGAEIAAKNIEYLKEDKPGIYKLLLSKDEKQTVSYEIGRENRIWEINTSPIISKFNTKTVYGYVKYIHEITESVKTQAMLEYLAKTDELSEMNNRREFLSSSQKIFEKCKENALMVSVISMDIDDFKSVNDEFGHHIGDEVIRKFSQIIRNNIRKNDISGRIGGEEFTIVLPNISIHQAYDRAELLRKQLAKSRLIEGRPDKIITVSIGVAQAKENENLDNLLIRADRAMYISKRTGKNKTSMVEDKIVRK